jgi:hypothetical protein
MKKSILFALFLLLSLTKLSAQSNTVAVGGELTGSGGTASITAGEVFYTYKSSASGSATEGMQQSYLALPTAVISGDATVCSGSSTQLSIALTGTTPWSITYTDGTTPVTVNAIATSPYTFSVSPSETTTYTLVALSDSQGTATSSDLSGSAMVTVTPLITYYADSDGDGYGNAAISQQACVPPANYVTDNTDCNDTNASIYPGATEICYDGIDQNCDGTLTDGCPIITARLRAENCDTNLTSLRQVMRGDRLSQSRPSGVTVTGYRFRVTNLLTNEVRIVERSSYIFQLTYTDFAEYDTPYSVEVAVRLNQEWMEEYGAPCTITTPGVPNTVLAATSCGATVVQMNNIIRAVVVPSALRYEYNVALIENGIPVATTTLIRSGGSFNLLQLSNIPIKFASEYSVTIRVEVPTSSGAQWSTLAGAACSIFTPLAPEAVIEGCGSEAGITASLNTPIFASPMGGATQYRFTLTDGIGYNQVFTTPSRYFRLSNFNALSPLPAGGSYSVEVEVELYGNYYTGKDCNIIVPGGLGRPIEIVTRPSNNTLVGEFKAVAYPNPFANSFSIDLKSNSTSEVSLAIYDMTGRLLETRAIKADGLASQTIGERYPSGVYSVVVTQGDITETLRVIKR